VAQAQQLPGTPLPGKATSLERIGQACPSDITDIVRGKPRQREEPTCSLLSQLETDTLGRVGCRCAHLQLGEGQRTVDRRWRQPPTDDRHDRHRCVNASGDEPSRSQGAASDNDETTGMCLQGVRMRTVLRPAQGQRPSWRALQLAMPFYAHLPLCVGNSKSGCRASHNGQW
jgi:hypothetical protein